VFQLEAVFSSNFLLHRKFHPPISEARAVIYMPVVEFPLRIDLEEKLIPKRTLVKGLFRV
jgi:hypothetical protein